MFFLLRDQIRVFEGLAPEDEILLGGKLIRQLFRKGDILFREGSRPAFLYGVLKGKIKVFQTGIDGREQIVHLIRAGDIMGHRAICGDDNFSGTAEVMDDADIIQLPRGLFVQLLRRHPELGLRVARLLADELKDAELKITQMAHSSVRLRLAQTLLDLVASYGLKKDQLTINVLMSRENLASLAGTTRESVTRLLHEFGDMSLIVLSGRQIQIINMDALRRFVRNGGLVS